MNIKSEKGSFIILFALMVSFFIGVLFLGFHKNISSFISMEQKQRKNLSENKIKQIILKSLENYKACSKTFSKTNESVTKVKNFSGKQILDFSVRNVDFYKKSGFFEKTGFRIAEMKIREKNPKNFKIPKPKSPLTMESYIYPIGGTIRHSIATLEMMFSNRQKPKTNKKYLYAPIYIQKKYGRLDSCSTSEVALDKLRCKKQSTKVICCRYIYQLTLDPLKLIRKEIFPIRQNPYIVTASPGSVEQIGFIKTTEDPDGNEIAEDCQSSNNTAQLKGFCTYSVNWVLETSCK